MQPRMSSVSINELEKRIKGTRNGEIIRELFTNSIHFPLANTILELLLASAKPLDYISQPNLYVISLACVIQAYFLGSWKYKGYSFRLFGNLIGPTLYTIFEFALEGGEFFKTPNHLAYWMFSFVIGILQEIAYPSPRIVKNILLLFEHFVRTNILLITYWIFEASHNQGVATFDSKDLSFLGFLSDHSHQYIAIVLVLLGLVIGFANITAANYLEMLRDTAKKLRRYSEWLFGRELLSQAVINPSVLTLQRRERTIIFMDIRGFTSWSETKTPEEVVAMLNAYFETAEMLWANSEVIKVKHTADEIMAVFPTADAALHTALQLREQIGNFLKSYGLSAGIGVHRGPLVEGLIGSQDVKTYDIIGDTVNTAKRICDHAAGGEVLISHECYSKISQSLEILEPRLITVKGKREALQVYPVA